MVGVLVTLTAISLFYILKDGWLKKVWIRYNTSIYNTETYAEYIDTCLLEKSEQKKIENECTSQKDLLERIEKSWNKMVLEKQDYNCADFDSQLQAQGFFEFTGGPKNDYYGLDGNHNGFVCESYKKFPEPFQSSGL